MNSHVPGRSGRSVQEIWEDFSLSFTPAVREVVEFAKHIPGFQALSQHDQVTLLKAGTFEVRPGMARARRRAWCPMALHGAPQTDRMPHGIAWCPTALHGAPWTGMEPQSMGTGAQNMAGVPWHCSAPRLGAADHGIWYCMVPHGAHDIAWCLTSLQCPIFGICGTEHSVPVMARCPVDWHGALQHCSSPQTGVVGTAQCSWHYLVPHGTALPHFGELWHGARCPWHGMVPHIWEPWTGTKPHGTARCPMIL